ncbi:MAG: hypothetical protein HUU50_14550 [Candidatus Brocadiae bacterium]|nr:hypothetical protein [Candidatus Brocadiia bacterium]
MALQFPNELIEKRKKPCSISLKSQTEIQAKTHGKYSPIIIIPESLFLILAVAISLVFLWFGMNEPWDMQSAIASLGAKKEKKVSPVTEKEGQETYLGKGETKEKALQDAKRNAILKELGEWISVNTKVKEFCVVQEEILSKAEGYVSEVQIVSENQNKGIWEVRILCKISPYKIINSISQNPQLQGFQKKRVVVTYRKDLENTAQLAGIKQLASHVQEFMNQKGFKMFIEKMALSLFQEVADEFKEFVSLDTMEQIKELATDFLICLHLEKRESPNKGTLLKITFLARNRVGNDFGSFTREYPAKSLSTVEDWEEAVNQCASEFNELLYKTLLHQISLGDRFTFHFQNYTPSLYERIEETIASLPYTYEVLERKKELRMDITGWDKVDYNVRKSLKNANIPMEWNSMGNWLFIRKPNLWRFYGSISLSMLLCLSAIALIAKRHWKKTNI